VRRAEPRPGPGALVASLSVRVAEVAPPWLAVPPRGYGGIEWVVSLLADGLAEVGHDVTLFATGDSMSRARLEYAFETAPGPKHINDIWYDTVHTALAFRDPGRFDLFHVHSPWSALTAGAAARPPVVHTVHGSFSPKMRQLYEAVAHRVWFVAISESQRAHMPELPYAGTVHNGIDVDRYRFRPDKEDFVLFLGRAHPDKGILPAVLAAKEAGVRLVVAAKVAHPDEEEHWRRDVLPALGSDVIVVGEIGHEEKLDLLSGAGALLFPIDWDEPFGLVMAEAMACGTPVIATDRGAVPEVVEHGRTGFVLPVEGYAERAAEAIRNLSHLDPWACRARVEDRFSKQRMVSGYERAFGVAVDRPPSEVLRSVP
jgi:glycosyltransferase involved in cell wall biosynthesis